MDESQPTLAALQARLIEFRDARDWRPFHQPKELALAMAVEAGELLELFLWHTPQQVDEALADSAFRARLAEEMADVLIYLLYLADAAAIDLASAVTTKLRQNEARYPVERARGRATKYTDLQ